MLPSPPSPKTIMSKSHHYQKPPSLTNVNAFPSKGWALKDQPITAIVPGCIGDVIGYKDYYFLNKRILCTQAFSTTAVATTVDNGATLPGSTKLDSNTGHNCKMPQQLYRVFLYACAWHSTRLPPCPSKQTSILEHATTGHQCSSSLLQRQLLFSFTTPTPTIR
jgi:hypothetical protein